MSSRSESYIHVRGGPLLVRGIKEAARRRGVPFARIVRQACGEFLDRVGVTVDITQPRATGSETPDDLGGKS